MGISWSPFKQKRARRLAAHMAGGPTAALADHAHWIEVNAVARELKTARPDGLEEDEANRRLEE